MVKKIFFVIITTFFLLMLLQAGTHYFLLKNINFKTAYIATHPIEARILIHGPCEPEWMMDPQIIDSITNTKSYNLALNHSDFADNYLHLYLYLKNQPPPEYFFLYATPESFDPKLSNTFNTYRFAAFLDDKVVLETVTENDPKYIQYHNIPMLRYSYYGDFIFFKALQGAYYSISGRTTTEHPNGYKPAISSWNVAIQNHQHAILKKRDFKWSALREKYFRKTIELALSYHCKVYVYESPFYEPDKAQMSSREPFLNKIKAITESYKVPYLIFDGLPMANDSTNFFATYNTTYAGSCKFSKIFAGYIRDSVLNKHQGK